MLPFPIAAVDQPEPPLLPKVFGSLIALALLVAVLAWIVFGIVDLYRREDIGRAKKLLWAAAFVVMPIALIVYGAVRFSRTGGNPGW